MISKSQASAVTVRIRTADPCYPKQGAFVYDEARYTWVESGTKTGKTIGMLFWIFVKAMKGNGGEYWWVAPVYRQAKIAYRRLRRSLAMNPQITTSINESALRIELIGGSAINFISGENPDNLYGEDVRAAVLDECSRMREESFHAVRSTLTATGGSVKLIGNVKGRKNWFYHGARKAEAGEPNHSYHKLVTGDNPYISAAEIQDAQRMLPESVFNELYLAIATEDGSNPFGIQYIAACKAELSAKPAVVWGIDLAKSFNWSVAIALDEDGAVCRFERWQGSWQTTKERIKSLVAHMPAFIDSTGVGDPIVEELQAELPLVTGFKFSSTSKQQLMEGLASAIQQRQITFPDGPIRSELECFEFEYTRTGVRYGAPEGMNDDCVCALALAWSGAKEAGRGARLSLANSQYQAATLYA